MNRKIVKVIILRTAGTNCDRETAFAFESVGAKVDLVHIHKLLTHQVHLADYHILTIPGGFTYGDDIESGRLLANELSRLLGRELNQFIHDQKLILGICNGFQVLVKSGLLPYPLEQGAGGEDFQQQATLMNNDSGRFEDRWTYLKVENQGVWLEGLGEIVYFPVAHGEGKFIPRGAQVLQRLKDNRQIALRYCTAQGGRPRYPDNPNGSVEDIAGITDKTGRILGLMPHPERHFLFTQHPFWTRLRNNGRFGQGVKIFENGVLYVKRHLL